MDLPIVKAGVMGWPVGHSLSPRLHDFWLKQYKIAGSYQALPVKPEDLIPALRGLREQGLSGVNLTVPHKVAACAIVDHLHATAQRIGAVNLIMIDEVGKLQGRNTDAYGFMQNLVAGGFRQGKRALVLGAGGASRAILVALIDMGFQEIIIANRTKENAERVGQEFTSQKCKIDSVDWSDAAPALDAVDLLVNTTSLGMKGQPPLGLALDALPQAATVTDIVYAPLETDFLRRARQKGHHVIDGLGMLLHQARPAFKAFFGVDPEVTDTLRTHVLGGKSC